MIAIAILGRLVHYSIVNILENPYRTTTTLSKIAYRNS